ncbi:acyl-CoA thioesterase [Actinomycetospora sp. CA-084318]|uniref:acyl-CoA thioesterase n=1 Tax=Actinomycetospora sp. CA-084318 TaxID=3239892 RepID=UPI003D97CCB8
MSFAFPVVPRYAEIDQQNVVFFGHYLTWCDEAMTGFLASVGYAYPEMIADGVDIQVVHASLDYATSVRWGDEVSLVVTNEKVGTTSLASRVVVRRRGDDGWEDAVTVRLVHVCVDSTAFTKVPVPPRLAEGLAGARG